MPKDRSLYTVNSNPEPLKRVFSVDDDIHEIENDHRQFEGLPEGSKYVAPSKRSPSNVNTPPPAAGRPTSVRHKNSSASVAGGPDHIDNTDQDMGNSFNNSGAVHGDEEDQNSIASNESYTLRRRQDAINETHPFGIRIWKPALYKKKRSVQKAAKEDIHETTYKRISWKVHLANNLWAMTLGLFFMLFLSVCSLLVCFFGLFTPTCLEYASVLFRLGRYLFWPFGKIVLMVSDKQYLHEDQDEGISAQQFYGWVTNHRNRLYFHRPSQGGMDYGATESGNMTAADRQRRLFGRGQWSYGRFTFYVVLYLFVQPVVLFFSFLTWLAVFTIPMSGIMWDLMYHCRRHPLALEFKTLTHGVNEIKDKNVLLCTFRSAGSHYYKYTVDGTNVIVMNLGALVAFTIIQFYILQEHVFAISESVIFCLCLLSIIPLAFYIGQAVASISAQTSMGVGAAINAFFSTIVEIFLYCVALQQEKGLLVEGSMIGSILGAVLLLPGMSMCGGAFKRKTQRYNPASAGVSSAMLIFSMIVMFVPTIIYQIYGGYLVDCSVESSDQPSRCYFRQPPLKFNALYLHIIKPMSLFCAFVLFLAYTLGLWFTLRTHAATIWQVPEKLQQPNNSSQLGYIPEEEDEDGGHDGPNWSRQKSTCILLGATLLYAIIAEILVDCVDNVLKQFPSLDPKFLGLTVFALVPNTTEFLNAISFAIHGNVALSMEIGSAYALQVCLLQIPALVVFSIMYTIRTPTDSIVIRDQMFSLVFPRWDLLACMVSVFLFTYLYAEGKSNYFKGSILILLYSVIVLGFYFQGAIDQNNWDN
ncbi:LAME_0C08966g1_1 [Lachancea meyersii CBS 8951]|uniref:LAME_0C08966g1_1 n=1 Tax=Lachancea meyersii CBS 8951 TaxID=1266667 RepID=A0A1G4J3Q3_9SACH|nr:LAME_0C08966g1_1 [Lachancea meyersii CBS 8951]